MAVNQVTKKTEKLDSAYIHDYDKTLARLYLRIESDLSLDNSKLIKDYDTDAIIQTIGKAARIKHLGKLLQLSNRFNDKPWKEYTERDIKTYIAEIMLKHSSKGDETHSTSDVKKVIKIFFRWLYLGDRSSKVTYKKHKLIDAPITESIAISKVKNKLVREDLLTSGEKTRLLHACGENLRDRAMLAVKFEAGDRAGELLTAQIKHVKSDDYGAVIHVDGKTGARPIRLIESAPDLFAWINAHPFRDNPNAAITIDLGNKRYGLPMKYAAANKMLKTRLKKAEITKRITFTIMRHSAITGTANYLTEAQLKKRYGWTPGSKMPETYVHLVDADVEDAILNHHGMKKKEKVEDIKTPKICTICKNPNAWDSESCGVCGKPLSLEMAIEKEEIQKTKIETLESKQLELENLKENIENVIEQRISKHHQKFIEQIESIYDKENSSLQKRLDLMDKKFSEKISSIN